MAERASFEFQNDFIEKQPDYKIVDNSVVYFSDSNMNSYAQSTVRFTNQSLSSSATERWFEWSSGYLSIPISIVVQISSVGNAVQFTHRIGWRPAPFMGWDKATLFYVCCKSDR